MKRTQTKRPSLAPLDSLGREIQRVLYLVKPKMSEDKRTAEYEGYCGAASEAYLHLAGGRAAGLRVMQCSNSDGSSHWWLEGPAGVVDLTLGPSDRRRWPDGRYPYEDGRRMMFRTGYQHPSARAAAIIELVQSRRAR